MKVNNDIPYAPEVKRTIKDKNIEKLEQDFTYQDKENAKSKQNMDKVEISEEGQEKSSLMDHLKESDEDKQVKSMMEDLEEIRKQNKTASETARVQSKCWQIASRIISGHTVPTPDQRFLAKHDSGLYSRAQMLRIQKENPKEYDQLTKKGDEEIASIKHNYDINRGKSQETQTTLTGDATLPPYMF